jgi:hypothetical protein
MEDKLKLEKKFVGFKVHITEQDHQLGILYMYIYMPTPMYK